MKLFWDRIIIRRHLIGSLKHPDDILIVSGRQSMSFEPSRFFAGVLFDRDDLFFMINDQLLEQKDMLDAN